MGSFIRPACSLLAAAWLALHPAAAQEGTVVLAELFGPRAGWALESDDAFVLTKAGCLEMLTRIDFDGNVQPSLATAWTQSAPDTWDFTLRPGVRFADGTPLDAAAVAGALDHVLRVPAPPRSFSPRLVTRVEALDPGTVRITTPDPAVLMPLRLASPNTGILSPRAYRDGRIDPVRACTGPFTVVEDVPRQSMRLERNPAYWGGPVGAAGAVVRYIPDGQVRAALVQTGEATIATVLPVMALRAPPRGVRIVSMDLPRVTSLYLNVAAPPFNDVRVRRAVQAAMDTAAIAASVYEGLARPAAGPFGPGERWAPADATPVARDLVRARALLTEAGIRPGSLRIELLAYTDRAEFADLASVVQAELGEVGIAATIRAGTYASIEPDLLAGRFQAALLSRSHLADVPDPGAFLSSDYTCRGGYNISHLCRPELDAAVSDAALLPDPGARFQAYAAVASLLQREAIGVFLVHERQRDAVAAGLQGYRTHPLGHYILTRDLVPASR